MRGKRGSACPAHPAGTSAEDAAGPHFFIPAVTCRGLGGLDGSPVGWGMPGPPVAAWMFMLSCSCCGEHLMGDSSDSIIAWFVQSAMSTYEVLPVVAYEGLRQLFEPVAVAATLTCLRAQSAEEACWRPAGLSNL